MELPTLDLELIKSWKSYFHCNAERFWNYIDRLSFENDKKAFVYTGGVLDIALT